MCSCELGGWSVMIERSAIPFPTMLKQMKSEMHLPSAECAV